MAFYGHRSQYKTSNAVNKSHALNAAANRRWQLIYEDVAVSCSSHICVIHVSLRQLTQDFLTIPATTCQTDFCHYHPTNDPLSIGWDIRPYSLTH